METVLDARLFRQAMGMFGTGVTVISTETDGHIHAMTANAFTSASLDPPLVLVCLNRGSKMEGTLQQTSPFAVNFLSEEQEAISRHFAGGRGNDSVPDFAFTTWSQTPRLQGCLGTVACQVYDLLDCGDHVIVVGKVTDIYVDDTDKNPLLFWKGEYRRLQDVHPA